MSKEGAVFYKCALQVNSYRYNHDYRGGKLFDEEKFNKDILSECKRNNIEVVGLAEHGDVNSTEKLRQLLIENGITVFPGFELESTEKIHIICLFPPNKEITWLNQTLGSLQGKAFEPGKKTMKSDFTYLQLSEKVLDWGGITYAAHVHEDNGMLKVNDGAGGHPDIWKEEKLVLAAQINKASTENLEQKYKQIIENKDPNYKRLRKVAVIHAKDVEKPETLKEPLASCYIKMDSPSIEGLRQAFLDGSSRIRLSNEFIPKRHSKITSVKVNSNFFQENLELSFNKNLNAIIGGRGTGKSTLLECVRYGLDISHNSEEAKKRANDLLRQNFINGNISLSVYSARYDKNFFIYRNYGQPYTLKNEDGSISNLSIKDILPEIKLFGQNEIFEFAERPENHIKLIEQFLPELKDEMPQIQKALKENRNKLKETKENMDELESRLNREKQLKERLENLKSLGLDRKFEEQNIYNKEQALFKRSEDEFQEFIKLMEDLAYRLETADLQYLNPEVLGSLINKDLLEKLRPSWEGFLNTMNEVQEKMLEAELLFRKKIEELFKEWTQNRESFEVEFQKLINRLPDSGGRKGSDIAREFGQISRDLASMQDLTIKFEHNKRLFEELEKQRRTLIDSLNTTIDKRFSLIHAKARSLNKNQLKDKMMLEVNKWGNREPLKNFLKSLEGIGERKINWVDEQDKLFNIIELVKDIREQDENFLKEKYKITPGITSVLKKLPDEKIWEMEEMALIETVQIKLNIGLSGNPEYKVINDLSSGQKCTAILNLLLINNFDPLIVDQPEDNLDNAFIAENIVTELRTQKESRQFIFSTHNANIPVFGDAEWIGIMEVLEGQCMLNEQNIGSIDNTEIRPKIENILEGGKFAFETRRLKYNY
jgi:ABC-type lipoprotein export system ATPase subunit